jgi:hypothetical protein
MCAPVAGRMRPASGRRMRLPNGDLHAGLPTERVVPLLDRVLGAPAVANASVAKPERQDPEGRPQTFPVATKLATINGAWRKARYGVCSSAGREACDPRETRAISRASQGR